MALISLQNVSLSLGGPPLLLDASGAIEPGERVCLVGRNGTGKSTLMRLFTGELPPDAGTVSRSLGVRVTLLPQEVLPLPGNAEQAALSVCGEPGRLLAREIAHGLHESGQAETLWSLHRRLLRTLAALGVDPEQEFADLSGGGRRRALLAGVLAAETELILLDEPTNHLDLDAIAWLEMFLADYRGAVLFVTHDRRLAARLATRVLDLDRGRLTSWPGTYDDYITRKNALLEAEAGQRSLFDKKLAEEETWIRQGIKARRTRNEGRVRALEAMRRERRARRERQGVARLDIARGEISGKVVIEASAITHGFGGQPLIREFSTLILRGDKVGVIGPNGCGKTTLLRLLTGELAPEQGTIRLGTRLDIVRFSQLRDEIDDSQTLREYVGDGRDHLTVNGQTCHVVGYLRDFLFAPEQIQAPMKVLSGGERNRAMLARLLMRPSNLLIMDEPTNDLDVETLELLEDLLVHYQGTLLLVSHDRAFLDNVVTSVLAFEGEGRVADCVGGYDDWQRQRPPPVTPAPAPPEKRPREKPERPPSRVKLSYREQKELEALPGRIEVLEEEMAALHQRLAEPAFYRQTVEALAAKNRLERVEAELAAAYGRWEELEAVGR